MLSDNCVLYISGWPIIGCHCRFLYQFCQFDPFRYNLQFINGMQDPFFITREAILGMYVCLFVYYDIDKTDSHMNDHMLGLSQLSNILKDRDRHMHV